MIQEKRLSCADCAAVACDSQGERKYPAFCPTKALGPLQVESVLTAYQEEEAQQVMRVSARVEYEGYGNWTRVQEIIEFAKRMSYTRLGIATCVGLIRETRALAKLLRGHGFEVFGIGCKVGAISKTEVGIEADCMKIGQSMCNPILQARQLAQEDTQLNIVMGLCVGHDSLFYRNTTALATTLVTKDRVLGHNPIAALYTIDSYYDKLKAPPEANL